MSLKVEVEVGQSTVPVHVAFKATAHFEQLDGEKEVQVDTQWADASADLHVIVFMWDFKLVKVIRNVTDELLRVLQLMKKGLGDEHLLK